MSDEPKKQQSLACRIKDEVDALVASGQFRVVHMTYLRKEKQLQCGCAIGVVSACAGADVEKMPPRQALDFGMGLSAVDVSPLLEAIRQRWPGMTDDDAAEMECAFEGWEDRTMKGTPSRLTRAYRRGEVVDRDSEFYKLGKHIRKLAT